VPAPIAGLFVGEYHVGGAAVASSGDPMTDMAQRPGAGLFEPPPIGDPPWPSSARYGLPGDRRRVAYASRRAWIGAERLYTRAAPTREWAHELLPGSWAMVSPYSLLGTERYGPRFAGAPRLTLAAKPVRATHRFAGWALTSPPGTLMPSKRTRPAPRCRGPHETLCRPALAVPTSNSRALQRKCLPLPA